MQALRYTDHLVVPLCLFYSLLTKSCAVLTRINVLVLALVEKGVVPCKITVVNSFKNTC